MPLNVNMWALRIAVFGFLVFGSNTRATAAEPTLFMDRGFVHSADDLGESANGLRRVRVAREDGRVFDAEVGDTVIVQLQAGADPGSAFSRFELDAELLSAGARLYLVRAPRARFDALALAERLALADAAGTFSMAVPDYYLQRRPASIDVPPNDPRYTAQWYLERLNVEGAWRITTGTASTTVSVIDGGCDLTHPDLINKLDPGRDEIDGDDDPTYDPNSSAPEHGTACAGLIAAEVNNNLGIAGVCPECRLRCIRLIEASVPISADVRAFEFAKNQGSAVVSNSWAFADPTPAPGPLAAEIAEVTENGRNGLGTVVVFAAGNENRVIADDELAALPNVIAVGALTLFDEATSFSNKGPPVDVVSPIGSLTTDLVGSAGIDPTDYTHNFGGTSSACPLVAGIATLLISAKPDATAREIEAAIIETTRPAPFAVPDENGHDDTYGYGIVDAEHAMRRVLGLPEVEVDGGVRADSGMSGAPDASDAGDAGVIDPGANGEDEGGCDCRTTDTSRASHPEEPAPAFSLLIALLVWVRRRAQS